MLTLKTCKSMKDGIKLIEPNPNKAKSYLNMAEISSKELKNVESWIWKASISYYSMYYSLYALMIRLGIRCEIHYCSLIVMRECLRDFYSEEDIKMISTAFNARIDNQYYTDRPVNKEAIERAQKYAPEFLIKTKDIISQLLEKDVKGIREKLQKWK